MSTDCTITLDHRNGVYTSGDTLNGHIRLHTSKTKSIRGILITVRGYADVEWEERRSRTSNGKTQYYSVYYRAHEQYLNSVTYVAGQDRGDSFDLLPGIYEHSFICALPSELPTSCHEQYGKINYEVIVTIDRRLRFDNIFKKEFKVNHILDLNLSLVHKLPVSLNDSTEICCLCCFCGGGGEVRAEIKLPYSGAVPGQKIPFHLFVYNDSNNDISQCKVKLKKVMTFESTTPSTKCQHVSVDLDTKIYHSVLRLSRKEFKDYLEIPTGLPCTQLGRCIRTEYYIKGKVYMACCTSDIQIQIPITIGSIPFLEQPRNFNASETVITIQPIAPPPFIFSERNNFQTSLIPQNNSLPPVYNQIDLPSYEDAIQMTDHSDDESRQYRHNYNYKKFTNDPEDDSPGLPTAPPDDDNGNLLPNTSSTSAASASDITATYSWV